MRSEGIVKGEEMEKFSPHSSPFAISSLPFITLTISSPLNLAHHCYAYLIQRINSLRFGRLPVIKSPIL